MWFDPSMKNVKLSEHFSFYELTATAHGDLLSQNRMWGWPNKEKLMAFAKDFLEPIRDQFRLPVRVTSGVRCPNLNDRIGGAKDSQHVLCEAADLVVDGLDCAEGSRAVFDWIREKSGIPFGQLIHETRSGEKMGRPDSIWIHLSMGEPYRGKGSNREVLLFKNGLYQFLSSGR